MSYQCLSVLRTLCQVNLSSPKFPRLLGQGGLVPHDLRHQAAKVTLLEPSPLPRKTKAYTNLPKLIEGTKINFCITCQNQLSTKGNTCVTLCAIFFTPFTYVTYISLTNNVKWFKRSRLLCQYLQRHEGFIVQSMSCQVHTFKCDLFDKKLLMFESGFTITWVFYKIHGSDNFKFLIPLDMECKTSHLPPRHSVSIWKKKARWLQNEGVVGFATWREQSD